MVLVFLYVVIFSSLFYFYSLFVFFAVFFCLSLFFMKRNLKRIFFLTLTFRQQIRDILKHVLNICQHISLKKKERLLIHNVNLTIDLPLNLYSFDKPSCKFPSDRGQCSRTCLLAVFGENLPSN